MLTQRNLCLEFDASVRLRLKHTYSHLCNQPPCLSIIQVRLVPVLALHGLSNVSIKILLCADANLVSVRLLTQRGTRILITTRFCSYWPAMREVRWKMVCLLVSIYATNELISSILQPRMRFLCATRNPCAYL